jgi:signal transduction histidine kinase
MWDVFEQETSIVIPDTEEADDFDFRDTPRRSLAVYPIPDHGVFVLSSEEPDAFDESDTTLIEIFSSTLKGSLDQAESKRELRRNKQRLARQNERLEEFTGVVSHDLRSPLNTATGYLDLLEDEYDDERLDRIDDALDRMKSLVTDLLTLARQGKAVDETTDTSLTETIQRAWKSVPAAETTLTIDSDLGYAAVDESRLRQGFENLFRNAVEHSHAGSQIRVGVLPTANGFYVEDNGPGIAPDQRDRVFEHGYSTSEDGTGLGLAIVKRICEAHGWEIRVTERQEGGARFEITGVDLRSEPKDES